MSNKSSRLGSVLLLVAILAALAVGVMMFGARFGLWEPIVGFGLIRTYMNPIGYAVAGLGIVGLLYQLITRNGGGALKAFIASLIGVCLLAPMISAKLQTPPSFPPIHDITTDTSNPPEFVVLDESRPGAKNSLVYGGPEVAAEQAKAYPDIAPIQTSKTALEAFVEALRVAKSMGWEVVAEDSKKLRFEATARTPIYSFADDVVVVVTSVEGVSQVDIRSVSRIGRGDRGVNAARVREFINAFEE